MARLPTADLATMRTLLQAPRQPSRGRSESRVGQRLRGGNRRKQGSWRNWIQLGAWLTVAFSPALLCETARGQWSNSVDQLPNVHYFLNADQAPGVVASAQVARGARGIGTFQALSISGPEGLQVALARDGAFLPAIDAPVTTGMLVAAVYRFRVTAIPFRPGEELYPTVEIIDRVYAPAGREHRYPIPVVLTAEDLQLALDGALVTRVIYVEDGEIAQPIADAPGEQRVENVAPGDNALQMADRLGRPLAILRIGSRVPAREEDLTGFLFGCPPWIPLAPVPERSALIEQGQWPDTPPVTPAEIIYSESPQADSPRTDAFE